MHDPDLRPRRGLELRLAALRPFTCRTARCCSALSSPGGSSSPAAGGGAAPSSAAIFALITAPHPKSLAAARICALEVEYWELLPPSTRCCSPVFFTTTSPSPDHLHPGASLSSCSGAAIDDTNFDNSPNINPGIKCDCSYNASTVCRITKLQVPLPP
ncbi:hypothetical protein C2845_PM13G06940 [Panicum miliaceum]|uniref:Uncharacterized protein n=1 Tax=Panicum miliaceum TaxID=4540 RepID=A0A3L6RJA5_PANMI|nr:hypothetical protein C2845_PM13G06940 [Panicum miliaceum]